MTLIRAQRGLLSRIARELHITRGAVCMWREVPAERVVKIEEITGIDRRKLRPDLFAEKQETV